MDWHAVAAVLATSQHRREVESSRRLEAAWRERDCELDREEAEAVEDEPKKYACTECGKEFTDRFRYSGHANTHRKPRGAPPAARRPRGRQRENGKGLEAPRPDPEVPAAPPCPLCVRPLPLGAGALVAAYTEEGLPEEQAVRLAAKAFGLIRVQ